MSYVLTQQLDAISACNAGEQAAASLTGQAAADAFNSAVTGGATTAAPSAVSASVPAATATATATSGSDCVGELD